jgi:limonene-1,2-epoxide hydrolase
MGDPVREFIRAFNEQDLDALANVLDPEVELHSGRGLRKGIEAAQVWATKSPGGAQQTVVLDELYEESDRAVALITRSWHWEEDGSPAGEEEMAWMFELRDRRIRSWRPYDDRQEALRVAHFGVR